MVHCDFVAIVPSDSWSFQIIIPYSVHVQDCYQLRQGSGVIAHKETWHLSMPACRSAPTDLGSANAIFAYGPGFLYTHQGKPRRSIWTVSFCRDWPPCTAHRRRRSTSGRRCTQLQGGHRCTLLHLRHSCGHYIHTSLGCLDWWDWNNKIDMAKLDGQKVQSSFRRFAKYSLVQGSPRTKSVCSILSVPVFFSQQ